MRKKKGTSEQAGLPPHRILVVDDESTIVECLAEGLALMGHKVATASDGQTALDQALAVDFDLVITDLKMPRMGGLEFAQLLVALRPKMSGRIVFMTGDTGELAASRLSHSGAPRCLAKPFGIDEMLRALEKWWAERADHAAAQNV